MNHPVVVGIVDKQPNVLNVAMEEARHTKSSLCVVHAVGMLPQSVEFYGGIEKFEELHRSGRSVLDDVKDVVKKDAPELDVEYVLSNETPISALKHVLVDARLLVVGSDNVRWFERLFRSKIAGHMVRTSSCPVIVVPELGFAEDYQGDVVLALDGDTSAHEPIRFAFEQASRRGAALHVLHVVTPDTTVAAAESIGPNLSEVLAGWHEEFPDTRVISTIAEGEVVPSIAHSTETAGIVVIGRPHSLHRSTSLVRSTAFQVMGGAHCPIAVVPADYAAS